jgi:hypothetical protein
MKVTFACVRSGTRYGPEYVERLRNGIRRHAAPGSFDIACFTDQPDQIEGVKMHPVPGGLLGWWAKLALLQYTWRQTRRIVYIDLDTAVVGDLTPLQNVGADFAICENFTRAAGNLNWPCRYGSCVMVLNPSFGDDAFNRAAVLVCDSVWMAKHGRYGDQRVIEECVPDAAILQRLMPPGFFLGYRHLTSVRPASASLVIFAGSHKPHNCGVAWVREQWQ